MCTTCRCATIKLAVIRFGPLLCRSVYNRMECRLVLDICQLLLDSEVVPSAIGVITPYKAQEKVIKRELQKR